MNKSQRYRLLKIIDCFVFCSLILIICLNIMKAYLFFPPRIGEDVPFWCFWEHGRPKHELKLGLIFITDVSFKLLCASFLVVIGEMFIEIQSVFKDELKLKSLFFKKVIQIILLITAGIVWQVSWSGVL